MAYYMGDYYQGDYYRGDAKPRKKRAKKRKSSSGGAKRARRSEHPFARKMRLARARKRRG